MNATKTTGDYIGMVYNAENGFFNALNDTVHKIFSPSTYECSLCLFTYGLTGMVRPWKQYIETLPLPVTFLYRTDFAQLYPGGNVQLPVIFAVRSEEFQVVLGAEEIRSCGTVESLITAMNLALRRLGIEPAVVSAAALATNA